MRCFPFGSGIGRYPTLHRTLCALAGTVYCAGPTVTRKADRNPIDERGRESERRVPSQGAPAWCGYHKSMNRPSRARTRTAPSVRQSVTMPAELAVEVERVARKKHLTMSRALVVLAQRGVEAEVAARKNLNTTYRRFMAEADPQRKSEAGKDLIRSIFGTDAIAEDTIL